MVLMKMKQTSTQINNYLPHSYKCNFFFFLKGGIDRIVRGCETIFYFKIKNTRC
jgi:hypothetical protein